MMKLEEFIIGGANMKILFKIIVLIYELTIGLLKELIKESDSKSPNVYVNPIKEPELNEFLQVMKEASSPAPEHFYTQKNNHNIYRLDELGF